MIPTSDSLDPRCIPPLARQYDDEHKARHARFNAHAYARVVAERQKALPAPAVVIEPPAPIAPIIAVYEPLSNQFEAAHKILRDITGVTVKEIQRGVAKHYKLTRADIVSPHRYQVFALPRAVAVCLTALLLPHKSLVEIGRLFNRDSTTLYHSLASVAQRAAANADFAAELDLILHEIGGPA